MKTADDLIKGAVPLHINADISHLSPKDRAALDICISAARIIDDIYFDQISPGNNVLRRALRDTLGENHPGYRYFMIHGGPWDRWNNDKNFLDPDGEERLLGVNFYPPDLGLEEWNHHLEAHPEDRKAFESPYTKIYRDETGRLRDSPYFATWTHQIQKASAELLRAATCDPDFAFARYLRLRAEALLTNNYEASDAASIAMDDCPIDLTIGPSDESDDGLLKLKAAYEACIVIRNAELSRAAERYTGPLEEFDAELAREFNYIPLGTTTPMVIGDLLYGSGAFTHQGLLPMAFDLPSDQHAKAKYGSKKVFLKNIMEAKFGAFTRVIAETLMHEDVVSRLSEHAFLLFIMGHEISHGAGPQIIQAADGSRISLAGSLREYSSAFEESKADALGLVYLWQLAKKGLVSEADVRAAELIHISDLFRQMRFGLKEDHARGALMQYNWLRQGGVIIGAPNGKFSVHKEHISGSLKNYAYMLMRIQRSGDYKWAKSFVTQHCAVPQELSRAVSLLVDFPVDFEPIFDYQTAG